MDDKWIKCPKCGQPKMKVGYLMCWECNQKKKHPPKKVQKVYVNTPPPVTREDTLRLENVELSKKIVKLNDRIKELEDNVTMLTASNKFLTKSNDAFKKYLKKNE